MLENRHFCHLALRASAVLGILCGSLIGRADIKEQMGKSFAEEIKKSKVSAQELGLWVSDEHGAEIYGLNADKTFVPASLSKLLTGVATLEAFREGEKFVTELASDATIENGVLNGSLVLKGGGDPSFVSEKMWYLVNEFVRTGVREISGDIIVDDSLFDGERFDPGRDPARVNRAYDAPIGAMSFNWNSVNIFVRPGKKAGDLAQVVADPISSYITLKSDVKTGGKSPALTIERTDGARGDVFKVTGTIPVGSSEIVKYASVTKPDLWAGFHLVEFLKQRGILVRGQVNAGKAPSKAVTLAKVEGATIPQILSDMLKFSNNYIAEMLTKQFAVKEGRVPATMESGLQAMGRLLQRKGLNPGDYSFSSPSGLSQRNKIKPRKLGELLVAARKDLRTFPELATGLPIAGVDGTIKSRMKGTLAESNIRGKTGLLTGAIGLAGYAGRRDGSTLSYVFIYNGDQNYLTIWSLFDSLAARLIE